MSVNEALSLGEKLLLAAFNVAEGDPATEFTGEDLVVKAWQEDTLAFGLRGYESSYPDSNKVYTKIDGKSGLVTKGWLTKVGERRLRMTEAGLGRAISLNPKADSDSAAKLDRSLQDSIGRILSHPEFQGWLKDPKRPERFRGAGHFWDVAPGNPPAVVKSRIMRVESTLREALTAIEERGLSDVLRQRGQALFERRDIELALEFQKVLKDRFAKDLSIMLRGT